MAGEATEVKSEVKSVLDILKAPGDDEQKFGLLIGLIQGNQVSNKDVVDTVLHLVSQAFNIDSEIVGQAMSMCCLEMYIPSCCHLSNQ